jgi:hypothetical protein
LADCNSLFAFVADAEKQRVRAALPNCEIDAGEEDPGAEGGEYWDDDGDGGRSF